MKTTFVSAIAVIISCFSLYGAWQVNNETSPTVLSNEENNWSLKVSASNGNLTITGYTSGSNTLDLTSCELDTGWRVTAVGKSVFSGNTQIKGFIGPDVISLGNSSFYKTTALSSATVSDNITTLGDSAFSYSAIKTLLPEVMPRLTTLGGFCFWYASSLVGDFEMPKITAIPQNGFCRTKITSLYAPSVTSVAENSFYMATSLKSVHLSTNITSIGDSAFSECNVLTTFYPTDMPKLKTLVQKAFYRTYALTGDFNMPLITAFNVQIFCRANKITSIVAPKATSIGKQAFYECLALTNIVLTGSSATIPTQPFYYIASKANIWWLGKQAPVLPSDVAIRPKTPANGWVRINVRNGEDEADWKSLCTRTTPSASDLARPDVPSKRRIMGVIDGTCKSYAWVIRWQEPTVVGVR